MKKCPNCNAMMEDDALFCGECGTKFEVEDVSDQVEETAIPLEKKCIHCGESIEEDSAFCPFCGKPQTVEEVMPVEEVKKAPKKETIRNEVQKPKPLHEEPIENGRVIEVPDFTNEVIENNTSRTNRWIWAILILIGLIGGAWYYYSQQNRGYSSSGETTAIDTTLVDTTLVDDNMANYSNARDFLEQFYKGENGDEGYIEQFVTANVLNKLKRDYEYDNCNDCLATWVFTAYPAGADYDLEGGPYISETEVKGRYKVDFKYSVRDGNRKEYRTRTVYLTVTEKDGKYLISDYETIEPERDMEAYEDVQEEGKEIDTPSEDVVSQERSAMDARQEMMEKHESPKNEDMNIYDNVDQMPSFPSGQAALMQWLSSNMKYPTIAAENGIQGRVNVQFVVEKDGSLSNVHVVSPVDPSLDKEALRVVKSLPRMIPGKKNGSPVRVKYTVPVTFKL